MWNWIKRHWKPIATIACTGVAVGVLPISPVLTATVGAACAALATPKSGKR